MKKIEIVIGSAFGDEGKGLMTDYLSARVQGRGCVVRFNGGAQAGHSVQTADGKRHVFGHFGSGGFAGLPTYLSSFYVCNPIIYLREMEQLAQFGLKPDVFADPACPVTTPYDIMINQAIEDARGAKRHGSVGLGFGETIERQLNPEYALNVRDLCDADLLRKKLDAIRRFWVPKRLKALAVKISDQWQERFTSDAILERFVEDVDIFLDNIHIAPLAQLDHFDHLVFEGAQGLLLDQDRGWFPHVTRSYTGVRNALQIARQLDVKNIDVYYMTRCYTTRHGAGPLPQALAEQPYKKIYDPTNKPNAYQGDLRFAWFDQDLFRDTVLRDMGDAKGFNLTPRLGMTCLDQVDDQAGYVMNGRLLRTDPEKLAVLTAQAIGAQGLLTSFGPTRETMNSSLALRRFDDPLKSFKIVQNDHVAVKRQRTALNQSGKLFVDALA